MSFFNELKRRNVVRVGFAYAVATWLLIQVTDIVFPRIGLPDSAVTLVIALLGIGFIPALIFAWAFEMTPEGIKREREVDRAESITGQTGRRLDFMIIATLGLIVAWFLFDEFYLEPREMPVTAGAQQDTPPPATEALSTTADEPVSTAGKSVAVLPFRPMSSGEDDEYFADGLTEEILNSLAAVQGLLVTARTSSFHFKGQDLPVTEIGRTLGVEHIVEGSVRRSNDQVRITAQLVRSEDGFHLWSQTYDRTLEDVFAVQEDIASNITATLDVLLDEDQRRRMRDAGIGNVEAYIAYQKALAIYNRAHELGEWEILQEANQWFDRAIELVPDLTDAYLWRTDYYQHLINDNAVSYKQVSSEDLADAQKQIRDNLELARKTARTEEFRAVIAAELILLQEDWSKLPAALENAFLPIDCTGNNWLDTLGPVLGRADLVIEHTRAVELCDPLDSFTSSFGMYALISMGQAAAAIEWVEHRITSHGYDEVYEFVLDSAKAATGEFRNDPEYFAPDPDTLIGIPQDVFSYALTGDIESSKQRVADYQSNGKRFSDGDLMVIAALHGDRDEANRLAALINTQPGGSFVLLNIVGNCLCGALFDLDAAPALKQKIESAGVPWPPPSPINYPAKDW